MQTLPYPDIELEVRKPPGTLTMSLLPKEWKPDDDLTDAKGRPSSKAMSMKVVFASVNSFAESKVDEIEEIAKRAVEVWL